MSEAGADGGTPSGKAGYRVLIVEDEPDVADLYAETVREQGYEVDVARNMEAAIDAVGPEYDIVLLDRRLPDGVGSDLLDAIDERDLDMRVGMVTAVEPDFDIVEMGFDLYLLKPVSKTDLVEAVETLEKRNQYDDALQRTASLASKRAVLQAEKSAPVLDASEEYGRLTGRLEELDEELDALTEGFDVEDYRRIFRDIGGA